MNRFVVLFMKTSRDQFYTDLTNEHIHKEDYLFPLKVWDTFKCKTSSNILRCILMLIAHCSVVALKTLEMTV